MKENTNWWEIFSFFLIREKRSGPIESSVQVWIEHYEMCPAQKGHFPNSLSRILWYWMSQGLHILKHLNAFKVTGQIHQSRLEYKLLLKVQMIGSKAGIIHRLFHLSELELIEIFNKTRGMWTWAEPRLANTLGYITRVISDFTCPEPNQSDIS